MFDLARLMSGSRLDKEGEDLLAGQTRMSHTGADVVEKVADAASDEVGQVWTKVLPCLRLASPEGRSAGAWPAS